MSKKKRGVVSSILFGWLWDAIVLWFKAIWYIIKLPFKLFAKKKETPAKVPKPAAPKHDEIKPFIVSNPTYDVVVAQRKDDCPLAYSYSRVPYILTDEKTVKECMENGQWEVEPKIVNNEVHLFAKSKDIGTCTERSNMIKDWLINQEPLTIYLDRITATDSGQVSGTIMIAFYRDRRKGQEWRKQSVVALTAYRSEDVQMDLESVNPGDPVEFEDEFDGVSVTCCGAVIGKLPKSYCEKVLESSYYGAFVEEVEEVEKESDFTTFLKPTIRIYW